MTSARESRGPLAEHQLAVEEALVEHMRYASSSGLPLYRMMSYQLGWVDRDGTERPAAAAPRFHGSVCLEAGASITGEPTDAPVLASVAVGMELLRESIVVHEDMQNAELNEEDRPAVWWVWGPAQAINVGDGLHALARLAVFRMRDRGAGPERTLAAVGALDTLALRYYEGEYLELTYQERVDVTEAQYVRMAEAKAGALLGGAAAMGARASGADDARAEAFRAFGERLGCAAQVRDDAATLWGADAGRAGRVLNKSKLYPVVHALEHGSLAQKRALGGIYFKRVMEPQDVEGLRRVLDETGAREQAEAFARDQAAEALGLLDGAGIDARAKERWAQVAAALVSPAV